MNLKEFKDDYCWNIECCIRCDDDKVLNAHKGVLAYIRTLIFKKELKSGDNKK